MRGTYCEICEAPTEQGNELCPLCQEAIAIPYYEHRRVDQEIGARSNAKLTEGFRMMKGQGE